MINSNIQPIRLIDDADKNIEQKQAALINSLNALGDVAIAVSGGVDSMLLAYIAHKYSTANVVVFHARSPAVPELAYQRLERFAAAYGWQLKCLNANELADENYVSNPVNRCFFCKTQLFSHIQKQTRYAICSGTNIDDLSDFRPGLKAAGAHNILQPYVDANITKHDIYALAKQHNLTDLQTLPAQPCLASRIETGIAISVEQLILIDQVEQLVAKEMLSHATVRCRVTRQGVFVELDDANDAHKLLAINATIKKLCANHQLVFAGYRGYVKGSAFLHEAAQ